MYDEPIPHDGEALDALIRRIGSLNAMGCDIIRFSYPSSDDRIPFSYLCAKSPIPVVADIHFDHRLALEALEAGAHKIRINPGNVGARWKVDEILASAKDHGAAIRIGLNSGSLPKGDEEPAILMSNTALTYLDWFEQAGFTDTVVSLKASDETVTVEANRRFASQRDPAHLGVTEAGSVVQRRGALHLGARPSLERGIGGAAHLHHRAHRDRGAGGRRALRMGLRKRGIRIVNCPAGRSTSTARASWPRWNRICSPSTGIWRWPSWAVGAAGGEANIAITGIGRHLPLQGREAGAESGGR